MTDSILEQIAKKVCARVALATGIVAVVRAKRSGVTLDDHYAVVEQGDPEYSEDDSHPGNPPVIAWSQPFQISLVCRLSSGQDTADDETVNEMEANVMQAITTPQASWHNWDGLAVNSSWLGTTPFAVENGAFAGRTLNLKITYRVDETDPFTARQ